MLEIISNGMELMVKSLGLLEKALKNKHQRESLYRLLYLETSANLELFSIVGSREEDKKLKLGDPRLAWIVSHLSTQTLELILLGDHDAFKSISYLQEEQGVEIDDETKSSYLPQNIYQVMKYLIIKISFMKSLLDSPEVHKENKMNFDLRMERIHVFLLELARCLRDKPEVRHFVRKRIT